MYKKTIISFTTTQKSFKSYAFDFVEKHFVNTLNTNQIVNP
jgi:hypothetical protein